jgi:hypothetical protein
MDCPVTAAWLDFAIVSDSFVKWSESDVFEEGWESTNGSSLFI